MIKHVGHRYKITEVFTDHYGGERKTTQVRDNLDDDQCSALVKDFLAIGCDYVRDDNGEIYFDNGFYLHGETVLGIEDVHVQYIGEWEEIS